MTEVTKVKGVPIEFADGRTLVVPPLSLAAVEMLQDRLAAYTGSLDAASVSLVIDALHAALKRNYPDMARVEVAELVDIANMQEVMFAVMNVAGLIKKDNAAESGEAPGENH